MDYRMQADDNADTANRRKTYIKQIGLEVRRSPKRFCILTSILIGGRVLSPDDLMHYKAIIAALVETHRLMEELETLA